VKYVKDNRLLPRGFDKRTADKDIAVQGDAAQDPDFGDKGNSVRYSVATGDAQGPFLIEAELWYQPISYRWAQNSVHTTRSNPSVSSATTKLSRRSPASCSCALR